MSGIEEVPSYAERMARLKAEADRPTPDAWMPEAPGETLVGTVMKIDIAQTRFGPAPVVQLRDEAGVDHSVWLLHTVLRNEFHRKRIVPGELVLVRFDGIKTPEGRDPYSAYTVKVDRPEQPFDWDQLDPLDDEHVASAAGADVPVVVTPPAPTAAPAARVQCPECGAFDGKHAPDCSQDIPF